MVDIVKAWKDSEYRQSLSPEQQAQLPPHPAGMVELADVDLDNVQGASFLFFCDVFTIDCSGTCGCSQDLWCQITYSDLFCGSFLFFC